MITIGFSSHHVEALPYAREQMERHQTIILEKPLSLGFVQMLEGTKHFDDYLLELDSVLPEFYRRMHEVFIELHLYPRRRLSEPCAAGG
jgi:hypothetical protein